MSLQPAGESPRRIDYRAGDEGREYLRKLAIPVVIVVLLIALLGYAVATYGTDYFTAQLAVAAVFAAGMIVGAVALFVLLRAYIRLRFFHHVITYNIKASSRNLPEIDRIVQVASGRLRVPAPGVYVVQDPEINAYALGLRRRIIVVNTGLIDATDDDELTFILGHELSHVKYGWTVPVRVLGVTVTLPMIFSSQRREYTCDRGGLIACRDLDKAVLMLAKLALGKSLASKIDVRRLYDDQKEANAERISRVSEALASHPPIRDRVLHLREFYDSDLYRSLTQ